MEFIFEMFAQMLSGDSIDVLCDPSALQLTDQLSDVLADMPAEANAVADNADLAEDNFFNMLNFH